jgi:hypothetical protein
MTEQVAPSTDTAVDDPTLDEAMDALEREQSRAIAAAVANPENLLVAFVNADKRLPDTIVCVWGELALQTVIENSSDPRDLLMFDDFEHTRCPGEPGFWLFEGSIWWDIGDDGDQHVTGAWRRLQPLELEQVLGTGTIGPPLRFVDGGAAPAAAAHGHAS